MPVEISRISANQVLVFLVSYIVITIFYFRLVKIKKGIEKKSRELEQTFESYITKKCQCKIVSGIDPLIFHRKLFLSLQLIYFLGFVIIAYELLGLFAVIIYFLGVSILGIPNLVRKVVKNNPYLYWKSVLTSITNKLSLYPFCIIMLTALLLFCNSFMVNYSEKNFRRGTVVSDLTSINIKSDILFRDLNRLVSDNVNLLRFGATKPSTNSLIITISAILAALFIWAISTYNLFFWIKEWTEIIGVTVRSIPVFLY